MKNILNNLNQKNFNQSNQNSILNISKTIYISSIIMIGSIGLTSLGLFGNLEKINNERKINNIISYSHLGTNLPVEKYSKITSPYGTRIHPITGKVKVHSGIDFGVSQGTNLLSVFDGEVIFNSFKGAYGYSIMIESNDKQYICHYAHVDPRYMLPKGTKIKKGDVVGKVGPKYVDVSPFRDYTGKYTNGYTTGPHLHFGLMKNGQYINPRELIGDVQ